MPLSAIEQVVIGELRLRAAQGGAPEAVKMGLTQSNLGDASFDEILGMDERRVPYSGTRFAEYNIHHLRVLRVRFYELVVYAVHSKTPVARDDLPGLYAAIHKELNVQQIEEAVRCANQKLGTIRHCVDESERVLNKWLIDLQLACPFEDYDAVRAALNEKMDKLTYPDDKEYGELAGKHIVSPIVIPDAVREF